MGEPQFTKYPSLDLSQKIFQISNPSCSADIKRSSIDRLHQAIVDNHMAPLYKYLAHPQTGIFNNASPDALLAPDPGAHKTKRPNMMASLVMVSLPTDDFKMPWDEALYERLVAENEKELAKIQKEEDEAVEKAGDVEVLTAQGKRAEYYNKICDKAKAVDAFEKLFEKTGVVGTKIDILMAIIRINMFYGNRLQVRDYIQKAAALIESGGDWDRRNRMKAYNGLHLLTTRSYDAAAPLLLDSLSTFTSTEICSYSSLIIYAILAGSVSLKRVDFKSKIVDSAEIRAVLGDANERLLASSGPISTAQSVAGDDTPQPSQRPKGAVNLSALGQGGSLEEDKSVDFSVLARFVGSFYRGEYQDFFKALADVETTFFTMDRHLYEHCNWFIHEMRLRSYQQLLQSYRIVGLNTMAQDFGITPKYLDSDLSKFIAAGRIPCTIDHVSGVIETNRPDDKNKQYLEILKIGDQLITKLQKYGQSVRLRGSERN